MLDQETTTSIRKQLFAKRMHLLASAARCEMESSKNLCIADASNLMLKEDVDGALRRLERAADYCFGVFTRPAGWGEREPKCL